MRDASLGQHRLRDDEAPECLRDAGPAGERGRVTAVAASQEDAATMLAICAVVPGERQLRQMQH